MIYYLIFLCFTPPLVLALHSMLTRLLPTDTRQAPQRVAILSCITGILPAGLLAWVLYLKNFSGTELFLSALYGVLVYACLSYAYFHLFNMSETARGIRILYELKQNGHLTASEIDGRYSSKQMLEIRLQRLEALGQIELRNGRYRMKRKTFYWISRTLMAWGHLLGFSMETLEIEKPR